MNLFWTSVWFLSNILFVTAVIVYLFQQRTYTEAVRQGLDMRRIADLKRRRMYMAIGSGVFFVLMCASFLINMAKNG